MVESGEDGKVRSHEQEIPAADGRLGAWARSPGRRRGRASWWADRADRLSCRLRQRGQQRQDGRDRRLSDQEDRRRQDVLLSERPGADQAARRTLTPASEALALA